MRRPHVLIAVVCAPLCLASGLATSAASAGPTTPAGTESRPGDDYVVTLTGGTAGDSDDSGEPSSVSASARGAQRAERLGGDVRHVYGHAVRGYAASLPAAAVRTLRDDPAVDTVRQDERVHLANVQPHPPWGLDRIDERTRPLSGAYAYHASGVGVTAYVIDTGIRFSHQQFGGRATAGTDTVRRGGGAADCNGHGTHVAGTVGGSRYGVAKGVRLVSVRVLDCSGRGFSSDVIEGVDWVTDRHEGRAPAVANMSLGGPGSEDLDTAVRTSVADGVTYTVAAGNSGQNACRSSPSRVPSALTVSATNMNDRRPWWASYGSCLDLFAPGVSVRSAWRGGDTDTRSISGTSMAAPHAAGVAARYLQVRPHDTPAQVSAVLREKATRGVVRSRGPGSPDRLLFRAG